MISEILRNALLQIYAPERLRGRLSSLYLAQVNAAPALGNTEAGVVAQLSSVTISVVSGGLACVGGALLLGALIPALRHATLAGPATRDAPSAPPVPEAVAATDASGPDRPSRPTGSRRPPRLPQRPRSRRSRRARRSWRRRPPAPARICRRTFRGSRSRRRSRGHLAVCARAPAPASSPGLLRQPWPACQRPAPWTAARPACHGT